MRKRFSFALLLLMVAMLTVVGQTRYCLSYEDFKNDKWVTLEDAEQAGIKVSVKDIYLKHREFHFSHRDKKINEIFEKEARFIVCDDMMFINLHKLRYPKGRRLFGKYYTVAYRYAKDKVCFVAPQGITLKGIMELDQQTKFVCYVMDSDELNVKQIKAEDMSALLAESPLGPGLYETYDKDSKESAEVIIRQLKKIDLLKPY